MGEVIAWSLELGTRKQWRGLGREIAAIGTIFDLFKTASLTS